MVVPPRGRCKRSWKEWCGRNVPCRMRNSVLVLSFWQPGQKTKSPRLRKGDRDCAQEFLNDLGECGQLRHMALVQPYDIPSIWDPKIPCESPRRCTRSTSCQWSENLSRHFELDLPLFALCRSPGMAKRKLEISEEAFTIRDQPSKAKKHKKVHKAIPVDAESSCDGGSISAPQRSTNALETQTENAVSTRDLQEQYDKLGKKAMEAVHEEDKIQGDIEKTADMAEVGKETSGRKAKKEKRKHTHKERPLGQHGVETKGEQAMKKLQAKPSKSKITEGKGRMKHKHRVKARQKQTRDNKQNNKKENIDKPREKPAWRLSDPSGGYLVDLDPIFSQDEK